MKTKYLTVFNCWNWWRWSSYCKAGERASKTYGSAGIRKPNTKKSDCHIHATLKQRLDAVHTIHFDFSGLYIVLKVFVIVFQRKEWIIIQVFCVDRISFCLMYERDVYKRQILDRVNRYAYAALSQRVDEALLGRFCKEQNFIPVPFRCLLYTSRCV